MTAVHDGGAGTAPHDDDPYLWLEEVHGERALAWVRERNAETQRLLEARADFAPTRELVREVLDAKERIPHVRRRGGRLYNFWQDEAHPRGLWRRTTLDAYRRAEPAWETLLDLDALAAAEGENWVWGGATAFGPAYRRALVRLSRGGADAAVVREFDLDALRFVDPCDGGFALPEAKSQVDWVDADTLFVGTDTGAGSLTDSGYPRTVRRWRRGTALADAPVVFEGEAGDVSVGVSVDRTPGHERTVYVRALDFYRSRQWVAAGTAADAPRTPLDLPEDAEPGFVRDRLLVHLRSDWQVAGATHPAGSLLMADAAAFLAGERRFSVLFAPTASRSLADWSATRGHVVLTVLDDVSSRVEEWSLDDPLRPGGREVALPASGRAAGSVGITPLHDELIGDDPLAEHYLLGYTDFLTPESLFLGRTGSDAHELLKSRPAHFDAAGLHAEQAWATSKDGTRVPYFIVWPRGVDARTPADGSTPTLLYGYGGFEQSMQPWYSGVIGGAWLARGGAFVVANIRGGGEYGPAWHQAAVGAHRQRSYDDFIAVAEELVARRITGPRHLGIEGGSNGGLLVGATFVQRPDLFNAVVCQVPLLDMRRYHRLLAGASWMAEYGDPDAADDWQALAAYSPYQNVRAGVRYPTVLFTTSTRDDRVHPGHARKMAARMIEQGHPVLYYENIEGGHGGAADNAQRAHLQALEFAYLWRQLGAEGGNGDGDGAGAEGGNGAA